MNAALDLALAVLLAASVFGALTTARRAPARRPRPAPLPPPEPSRDRRRRRHATAQAQVPGALPALAARRNAATTHERIADSVPDVVDLLAVAAASGCNVRLAIEAVASALHDDAQAPAAAVLATAVHASMRGGVRLADALGSLPADHPDIRGSPLASDAIRPVCVLLADAERYGTPLGPALERIGDQLRAERRRRAETRSRALPVRLLLPLVCCVFPAFALLTVAPLLVSGVQALTAESDVHHLQEEP